jgi:hypothetical protein
MQISTEKTMGDANLAPKIQKAPCGIKNPWNVIEQFNVCLSYHEGIEQHIYD